MKAITLYAGLICALCLFHIINAAPADTTTTLEGERDEMAVLEQEPSPELNRQKRATCDLLSGFGVKHSACAAHCLLHGKRGGHCNGRGVCECRK